MQKNASQFLKKLTKEELKASLRLTSLLLSEIQAIIRTLNIWKLKKRKNKEVCIFSINIK